MRGFLSAACLSAYLVLLSSALEPGAGDVVPQVRHDDPITPAVDTPSTAESISEPIQIGLGHELDSGDVELEYELTELEYELSELQSMRDQMEILEQLILNKEQRLARAHGWRKNTFDECDSIKCIFQTAYDLVTAKAKGIYSGLAKEGAGYRYYQDERPWVHDGNRIHGNDTHPHPPFHFPPWCKPPPHHGAPRHPPSHHAPPVEHPPPPPPPSLVDSHERPMPETTLEDSIPAPGRHHRHLPPSHDVRSFVSFVSVIVVALVVFALSSRRTGLRSRSIYRSLYRRIASWRRQRSAEYSSGREVVPSDADSDEGSDGDSDDGLSTTMEQEIAQFRAAADALGDMIAAEEGRAQARGQTSEFSGPQEMQQTRPAAAPLAGWPTVFLRPAEIQADMAPLSSFSVAEAESESEMEMERTESDTAVMHAVADGPSNGVRYVPRSWGTRVADDSGSANAFGNAK